MGGAGSKAYVFISILCVKYFLSYKLIQYYYCYSPDMPENEATFSITAGGVSDAKE